MPKLSRRSTLQLAAFGSAALALPTIISSRAFRSNERIGVGLIGVKNQGAGNLKRFQDAGANIVAVCDVDKNVVASACKLVKGPQPQVFEDYRRLLEAPGVDAVVISVPDHWHALMTIHACQANKDVYCEKPLSLTIAEGRRMVSAARASQRIVQTGSQQRSAREFWRACMLVRNGFIGNLRAIHVGIPDPNHPGKLNADTEPPPELNYDMWLGPAPYRPYNVKRVHYNFRFWWDYSGGQITNFGAHHLDIAQWALGMDESGPIKVEGEASFHPELVHEVTEKVRLTYTYANGVKLICSQGHKDIQEGARFLGSEGEVYVNRGTLKSNPPELKDQSLDTPGLVQLYRSTDHTQDFLNCVKSRTLPVCDVEVGHRSATVCHLGNMVARLGRAIEWDPVEEAVVNDPQAQSMVDRPYRQPYSLI